MIEIVLNRLRQATRVLLAATGAGALLALLLLPISFGESDSEPWRELRTDTRSSSQGARTMLLERGAWLRSGMPAKAEAVVAQAVAKPEEADEDQVLIGTVIRGNQSEAYISVGKEVVEVRVGDSLKTGQVVKDIGEGIVELVNEEQQIETLRLFAVGVKSHAQES